MTQGEVRVFLAGCDPALLRVRAGITLRTVGAALGVNCTTVWRWENRCQAPVGEDDDPGDVVIGAAA